MSAVLRSGWYPLIRASRLRNRPVTRLLADRPIRLHRNSDGIACAVDAASGTIRPAFESGGWVYAASCAAPAGAFPPARLLEGPSCQLTLEGSVSAWLGDVAENILDTTHTSVVHADYLRRPGDRRSVDVLIDSGEDRVSATYASGAAPDGWGARLIGAHRFTIVDTFRAPAIAEVTYTDESKPIFAARFWLTPSSDGQTYIAATIAVPGTGPWAAIKLAALRLFFLRIFAEDRLVLELIERNRSAHGNAPLVFTPQDVLRPGIEAILDGRRPLSPPARVALKV